jgi:hypothetical protein
MRRETIALGQARLGGQVYEDAKSSVCNVARGVRPAAGGRFDAAGFGLGGALYVSVMEFSNSELLAGIDGFIAANDSNVEGVFDDVLVRQLYLGGSLKWALGEERGFTLVTGIGYHLVDMAEVGDYYSGLEREIWEASRVSGHIGASWDLPGYSLGSVGRWMLGMKVHFADFGTVHGPGPIGPDAGRLDGPLYTMQVGYGSR